MHEVLTASRTSFWYFCCLKLHRQNELEELPAEVGDLIELRNLCISSNRLLSLPSSLGKLLLLEYLYANGNRLKALPDELGHLVNVKKVSQARLRRLYAVYMSPFGR